MATTYDKKTGQYNWDVKEGISGLMSGAGTGAAAGGPWGALIGGVLGLGSSFIPGEAPIVQRPENFNPYTPQVMDSLWNDKAFAQNWLKQTQSQFGGATGDISNLINQMGQMRDTSTYDQNAGFREFMGRMPQLQQYLANVYSQDRSNNEALLGDMKNQMLAQAQASLDQSGINVSSGAGLSALGSAAIQPLANQMQLIQQQYGNALNQTMGQQADLTSRENLSAYQAEQQKYQNAMAQIQAMLAAREGIAQRYLAAGQIPASMMSNITGILGQYGAPNFGTEDIYIPPQDNSMQIAMAQLANVMSNPQVQKSWRDYMNQPTGLAGSQAPGGMLSSNPIIPYVSP